jgi:hypothetical protein
MSSIIFKTARKPQLLTDEQYNIIRRHLDAALLNNEQSKKELKTASAAIRRQTSQLLNDEQYNLF